MLRIQDPNIDNVTDENGNMVDIYVLVNSSFNAAAGVDVQYSENKDLTSFFGDKTLILNVNPNRDEKGNLINFNSLPNNWGKLLAHERGHLAYIIPLHLKYMKYLEKKGKLNNPEYNAHKSNDDPSVEISRVYENNYLFKIKN